MRDTTSPFVRRTFARAALFVFVVATAHCSNGVVGNGDGSVGDARSDARRTDARTGDAATCSGGLMACDGLCVDTHMDRSNCGACGHACNTTETCMAGTCASPCRAGLVYCNDHCANTSTASSDCGGCGQACTAMQTCSGGHCVDDPTMGTVAPAYLPNTRTYDQQRGYIEWSGPVSYVTLMHRDNTSLPPSEGGASCGSGCTEQVTRIGAGGCVYGNFSDLCGFRVQLAAEPGAGVGVVTACGQMVGSFDMSASGTPGFINLPSAGNWTPPTQGACEWRICATGSFVDFRAVTPTYCTATTPPTVDLTVNDSNGPITLDALASFRLAWTSTNAATCTASNGWMGGLATSGGRALHDVPTGMYTYEIDCTNTAGSAHDAVAVQVVDPFVPPPEVDLKVDGNDGVINATSPASYTLTWASRNATACSVSRDPATVMDPDWTGSVMPMDARMMTNRPAGTYGYLIRCSNTFGEAVDRVSVVVQDSPM